SGEPGSSPRYGVVSTSTSNGFRSYGIGAWLTTEGGLAWDCRAKARAGPSDHAAWKRAGSCRAGAGLTHPGSLPPANDGRAGATAKLGGWTRNNAHGR